MRSAKWVTYVLITLRGRDSSRAFRTSLVLGPPAPTYPPRSAFSRPTAVSSGIGDAESEQAGLSEREEQGEGGEGRRRGARSRNPFLQQEGLPKFESLTPEASKEAFGVLLPDLEVGLRDFEADLIDFKSGDSWLQRGMKHDYEGVVERLERLRAPLDYAWGLMSHLKNVKDSEAFRDTYQELQPRVLTALLKLGQSKEVHDALRFLRGAASQRVMSEADIRAVDQLFGTMSVCDLDEEDKDGVNQVTLELEDLSRAFSANVLDATKAFGLTLFDKAEITGLADEDLALAARSTKAAGAEDASAEEGPWRFTLDAPSIFPCMDRLNNRQARDKLWRAYIARASSLSTTRATSPTVGKGIETENNDGDHDRSNNNEPIIERILELRKTMAGLLGYESYAECSVASKMTASVQEVYDLLASLRAKAYPAARRELEELTAFANDRGHDGDLAPCDVRFWGWRQIQELTDLSDREDIRNYFPLPKVLEGMFGLAYRLFGVLVQPADDEVEVWHPDVSFFVVKNSLSRDHVASFYLDPYARPENKRGGGAWTAPFLQRSRAMGRSPVVFLNCNLPPPVGDRPSLLSFKDVTTLFHEFGHSLQYMLTRVDVNFAGVNQVAWDAIELPSQFLENWCYHRPTVERFAFHYETGEGLPSERFDELCYQRTHLAGYKMLQTLYLAQLDMELHHRYEPNSGKGTVLDVQHRVAKQFAVIPPPPEDRSLCAATHIFAGGYAAGHFSYVASEVMSADAFAAFEEAELDDDDDGDTKTRGVGKVFADTVLSMGGSRDASRVFQDFRGRGPTPDALLRHRGLDAAERASSLAR
eukprot:g20072.t1